MNITKRQPVSVGEMITEEFLVPMALMLATVFGNTTDFWLNLQQRNELWKALNTPKRRARIEKAKPIAA